MPGSLMSSRKLPSPVMNRGSSRRLIAAPNTSTAIAIASPSVPGAGRRRGGGGPHRDRRRADCGHDVLVARAAADVAFDRVPDLLVGRVRGSRKKIRRSHDHAGGTEAALQAVVLPER